MQCYSYRDIRLFRPLFFQLFELAVPTSMADAPANINSMASVAFMIPPNPTIGIFTAW